MCLVSQYGDALADTLIRVARETGARYFKWDAIEQYGCDSPHHWHGGESNAQNDRWNSYAFQLPLQMTRIAEKVTAAIPDIIIDFDITEPGRAVGLSFLTAGRYFLINNGPYLFNYDLPLDRDHQNWNLFFYPGQARTWICRAPLTYDKWIPSILFLTHYFPDDPRSSQLINVGSLILGQNGIWGDLPSISGDGVESVGRILAKYKQLREDIVGSDPIVTGAVGTTPEIHEKISQGTGKGAVVLFATINGRFKYITAHRPSKNFWSEGDVSVHFDAKHHAVVEATFTSPSAVIVLFGTEDVARRDE
jgi:alpha-galactosidase